MRIMRIFAIVIIVIFVAGCSAKTNKKEITIGGKIDTEGHIMASLSADLLKAAGFSVKIKINGGSGITRHALAAGDTDLYYEYTGTAYAVFQKGKNLSLMNNPDKLYNAVKSKDAKIGLIWLDRLPFNDTYTIMVTKHFQKINNIYSISDLAKAIRSGKKLICATDAEYAGRPDGINALQKRYGFKFHNLVLMDPGLIYLALKNKRIDCGTGYSTDGRIGVYNLVNLKDDKHFFPIYNPAPVVRASVYKKYPEIRSILLPLSKELTTSEIIKLNSEVDIEHKNPSAVALSWLKAKHLIK